jgi:hypothetical protein
MISIIYEDDDIIVINKPAGIIVNRADTTKGEVTVQDWAEEKWSLVRASPLLDDEGHVRGIINFFQDVTEQKRLEFQSKFFRTELRILFGIVTECLCLHSTKVYSKSIRQPAKPIP